MRELLLLRHAKSSWDQPGTPDRERELSPRGLNAAARMGDLIQEQGLTPDLVLCSSARRTVDTWQIASARLQRQPAATFCDALYLAAPERILDLIRHDGGAAQRLLLVGHNPGLHQSAVRLTGAGAQAVRTRLAQKFPTGALARIGVVGGWADLAPGAGELLGFWVPRELAGPTG